MENKSKTKIAIFPGSFNPFHLGHLNILEKAEAIFGKENVIVAVGVNPKKISKETLNAIQHYNAQEKKVIYENLKNTSINRVKNQIPSKNVEGYLGFLTKFVQNKELEGFDVTIVKGLRNSDDFESEYLQSRYMWDQYPQMKIIYIPCDPLYTHISSTGYRELESIEEGSGHSYLALEVKK